MKQRTGFGVALQRYMDEAPDGRMSISELARRTNMPRSTVHRHLEGNPPTLPILKRYAEALGVDEGELRSVAGYGSPRLDGIDEAVKALAVRISEMSPNEQARLWKMVEIVHGSWQDEKAADSRRGTAEPG